MPSCAIHRRTSGSTTRLGFDPLPQGNGRMLSFIDARLIFIQPHIPID